MKNLLIISILISINLNGQKLLKFNLEKECILNDVSEHLTNCIDVFYTSVFMIDSTTIQRIGNDNLIIYTIFNFEEKDNITTYYLIDEKGEKCMIKHKEKMKELEVYSKTSSGTIVSKYYLKNSDYFFKLGNTEAEQNNFRNAIKYFNIAIEENQDDYFSFYNRARAKIELEDYRGAILDLNKCIEINSTFQEAYVRRGLSNFRLGNVDAACIDWSKAGELGYDIYDVIKENCN